jgi:hypothetical protein
MKAFAEEMIVIVVAKSQIKWSVEKQQKVIAKEKLSAIGRYRALRE